MCSVFIFILLYCIQCGLFFVFNLLWLIALLESMSGCLASVLENFGVLFDAYCFCLIFMPSSSGILFTHRLDLFTVFYELCVLFPVFSTCLCFHVPVCIRSMVLSSSLLIPSSAVSYLLLSPYIEFPISFLSFRFHLIFTS